jgi:Helix-turn-helix domain
MNPCLGEREAAGVVGVSVHTLRKWRRLRRGPAFVKFRGAAREGRGNAGRVVYRKEDLLRFLDAQTVPTEEPPMPEVAPGRGPGISLLTTRV